MDLSLADEGVVVLCAFCERHGPSILFVTAKLQAERAKDVFDESPPATPDRDQITPRSREAAKGEDIALESRRLSMLFSPQEKSNAAACGGCKSVEVEDGFVSFAGRQFCTSSKFPESRLYAMVRQVCVRSLSCEHVPGREGPVIFGQEKNGAVLSYPFQIADSQSRGFSRTYSLCAIHRDAAVLLAATRFVSASFVAVQKEMRARAAKLFEHEQRLELNGSTVSLRRVHKSVAARSLGELMGIEGFFQQLHGSFCNVLFCLGAAPPSIAVDCEGKVGLGDILAALGKDRFALVLTQLLGGGSVVVTHESADQSVLSERVWDSLKLLSPRPDELLKHEEQRKGVPSDAIVVQVAAGPKIHLLVGSAAKFRAPVRCKVVADVFAIAEKRMPIKTERSLVEAAVLEFAAAASVCADPVADKKTLAVFGLTAAVDFPFVEAWRNVLT